MYLRELFSKIPFPIGIWEIRNEKIFTLDQNYDADDYISDLKDGMLISEATIIFPTITKKDKYECVRSHYIVIYDFLDDSKFYEMCINTNNTEFILSTISSKIRDPINNVLGLLSIIKRTGDTNAEYIKHIKESCYSIVCLANNIIDVLNVYQGKHISATEEIEINSVIKDCISHYKLKADKKRIPIIFNDSKYKIMISNRDKFSQIIMNILDNSVKYTNSGAIRITMSNNVIKIADSGIGIKDDKIQVLQTLLDPAQEDYDTCIQGFGLLICKYISKELGIRITLKSTEGKGTKFYIYY